MTKTWTEADDAALLDAWEHAARSSGSASAMYDDFEKHVSAKNKRKLGAIVQRQLELRNAANVIQRFVSPNPETLCGDVERARDTSAWFRLDDVERERAYKRLNGLKYKYVALSADTVARIWAIERSTSPDVLVTRRSPWRLSEDLALVRALADSLDMPSRSSPASKALMQCFAARCGGTTKRSSTAVSARVAALEHFVRFVAEYKQRRSSECVAACTCHNWFALPPARRRAEYEYEAEANGRRHRFLDLDSVLFEEAQAAFERVQSRAARAERERARNTSAYGNSDDDSYEMPATSQESVDSVATSQESEADAAHAPEAPPAVRISVVHSSLCQDLLGCANIESGSAQHDDEHASMSASTQALVDSAVANELSRRLAERDAAVQAREECLRRAIEAKIESLEQVRKQQLSAMEAKIAMLDVSINKRKREHEELAERHAKHVRAAGKRLDALERTAAQGKARRTEFARTFTEAWQAMVASSSDSATDSDARDEESTSDGESTNDGESANNVNA